METRFFLDSQDLALVEIKRTGLPKETDKSKIYFWFLLTKSPRRIQKLDFISMTSDNAFEERIFQQGKLRFTHTEGWFLSDTQKYRLKNITGEDLPEEIKQMILSFFRKGNPSMGNSPAK